MRFEWTKLFKRNFLYKCTYDIKDIDNEIQIMNNRGEKYINGDIESKIKILNNGKKEKLVFKK